MGERGIPAARAGRLPGARRPRPWADDGAVRKDCLPAGQWHRKGATASGRRDSLEAFSRAWPPEPWTDLLQASMQLSYVGIMYLMLMKASSPPYVSKSSRVLQIISPMFLLFLWEKSILSPRFRL